MKKHTFVKLMKNIIKHYEDSEKIANHMKDVLKLRSTIIEDYADGLNSIFYDDVMTDDIMDALRDEFNDTEDILSCWFYEYRLMDYNQGPMTITKTDKSGTTEWNIGAACDEDDKNLELLYDVLIQYYQY